MTDSYRLKSYILVIRTTERCKVGCNHCSISANKRGGDQSLALALQAIRQARRHGVSRIHLSGGEPLLFETLPELVEEAADHGLITGFTSSTFTIPGEDNRRRLADMAARGMNYVMLSYDDPHSHRVPLRQFCEFVKAAQDLGLHVCVFVTEESHSKVTAAGLRAEFHEAGIDPERIDWTVSDFSFVGRGERFEIPAAPEPTPQAHTGYARCPIVLSAATLNPDGRVFLCNCSRLEAPYFTVGRFPDTAMDQILRNMESAPHYRYLARHGPQQALANLNEDVPRDMCQACEHYLTRLEDPTVRERVHKLAEEDTYEIPVDYEGLLPIYQRHMQEHGELLDESA